MKDRIYRIVDYGGRFGAPIIIAENLSYSAALERYFSERKKFNCELYFEFQEDEKWISLSHFEPDSILFNPYSSNLIFNQKSELEINDKCSVTFAVTNPIDNFRDQSFFCYGMGEIFCYNIVDSNNIENDKLKMIWKASSNFPFVLILCSRYFVKTKSLDVCSRVEDIFSFE